MTPLTAIARVPAESCADIMEATMNSGRADARNTREWARPENWRGGPLGLYSSELDTRVWVPKRNPAMGWTVNLAHWQGRLVLAALLALPLALLLWRLGRD
ncbi:MAG TPA: DUF5808 domain-containing protein [Gemmatimonadales bacterium]